MISSCVWRDLRVDLAVCDSMVVDELLYANTCPRLAPTRNYSSGTRRLSRSERADPPGAAITHTVGAHDMYTSLLDRRARPLGVSAAPPSDSPSSRALAVSIMYHRTLTSSSRVSEHVYMEGPPEGESDPNLEAHPRSPLTTRSSHGSLQLIIQQTSVSSPSLTCSAQCSAQPRPLCRVSSVSSQPAPSAESRRFRHNPSVVGFVTAQRSSVSSQPNGHRFHHSRSLSRMASLRTTSLLARGAV